MTQQRTGPQTGSQAWLDWLERIALLFVLGVVVHTIVGVAAARADGGAPPEARSPVGLDAGAGPSAPGATALGEPPARVEPPALADEAAVAEAPTLADEAAVAEAPTLADEAAVAEAPTLADQTAVAEAPASVEEAALANVAALRDTSIVPAELEERFVQGGWVMGALLGCSLLVVAVAFERWLATRRSLVWPGPLDALVAHADGIDRDALRVEVKSGSSVGERLVRAGLRAEENGAADAGGVVAEIGLREVARLRAGLPLLATLANMATMLGLFGTVLGMIDAFELIAAQGTGDPRVVAGGIFKALVTTAAGLGIGITALAIHAALGARVNGRVRELEDGLGAIFDPAAVSPPASNAS